MVISELDRLAANIAIGAEATRVIELLRDRLVLEHKPGGDRLVLRDVTGDEAASLFATIMSIGLGRVLKPLPATLSRGRERREGA